MTQNLRRPPRALQDPYPVSRAKPTVSTSADLLTTSRINRFHLCAQSGSESGSVSDLRPANNLWPDALNRQFSADDMCRAQQEIQQWDGYAATSLESLSQVAATAGVRQLWYKDESTRFGLGSFKALGGAYAVMHYLADLLSEQTGTAISMASVRAGEHKAALSSVTVTSATDGNHGRSVAWGARMAGVNCTIFIHRDVSSAREQAMASLGATVVRIDGDYDESVHHCAAVAKENNWQVISDTSYEGYRDIPRQVMAGYTVMVDEILNQTDELPTHVFIQAGVGGLAASIAAAFWQRTGHDCPAFIVVESDYADCLHQSFIQGKPVDVKIQQETMMAGLSCGEVSLLAFDILSSCVRASVTIDDTAVPDAMRMMAMGQACNKKLEAGECAVPGIIALLGVSHNAEYRAQLGLTDESRVLVFGCEGATDPDLYHAIVGDIS